jgi:hypothetical protein
MPNDSVWCPIHRTPGFLVQRITQFLSLFIMGVCYAWIYHDAWFWAKITPRSQMVSRTACGLWYFTSVGKAFHCSILFYRHDNYWCIFNFYLFQMGQINFNGFLVQMAQILTAQHSSLVVYCWVNRHRWWKLARLTDSWRMTGECLLSEVKCNIIKIAAICIRLKKMLYDLFKDLFAGNFEWLISLTRKNTVNFLGHKTRK